MAMVVVMAGVAVAYVSTNTRIEAGVGMLLVSSDVRTGLEAIPPGGGWYTD
jgi:hypothetical protein